MKILQINSLYAPRRYGGAEVFLERLCNELVGRGNELVVACLSPEPTRHGTEQLQVQELPLRNIYWPYDKQSRPAWRKLVWHVRNSFGSGSATDVDELLRRERPDLVHTHNLAGLSSAVWQAVRAQGVPLVHTVHDYALLCASHTMFRREKNCSGQCVGCRVLSLSKRSHSRAVDAVVGVSQFALNRHLHSGFFANAAQFVIQNGNPAQSCGPAPRRTDSQRLRVGYLGRLAPSKGIELMLESLAPLAPQQCEIVVGGAGDESFERQLKQRFTGEGVTFLGHVPSAEFMARIDVLVVPSLWHEPFGLVLCEAVGAGVPVIAAAVGGIPEFIRDGECGLLFEPGDAVALRGRVAALASDRSRHLQMSDRCQSLAVEQQFDRTVDRYLQVYNHVLN